MSEQSPRESTTARVRRQYEMYPYPPCDPKDEHRRLMTTMLDALPLINHHCFGGRRDFRSGFRVLVAGGGTGDASTFLGHQLRETDAQVVYVDLSEASMAIARERARLRGFEDRIQWIQGSFKDLPRMDLEPFDYINCTGVLHHLDRPEEGLEALRSVLRDDGAMGLMVYARYGRTAIYQLQSLLRLLTHDVEDQPQMVALTRELLPDLPQTNWFRRATHGVPLPNELRTDAGLFDLLLHSTDQPYTVIELYHFLDTADLHLCDFAADYRPLYDVRLAFSGRALEQLIKLPLPLQQAAAELYWGSLMKHVFWAAPDPLPPPDPLDPDNVPFFYGPADVDPQQIRQGVLNLQVGRAGNFSLSRPDSPPVKCPVILDEREHRFLELIDGVRTLGEIADQVGGDRDEALRAGAGVIDLLRPFDAILLRHRSVPAVDSPAGG
jgi:SAM-dependent methyltransferase